MCCGKKRATITGQARGMAAPSAPAPDAFAFRYIGDTSLTATGSYTGKTYRFAEKGAVQMVHRQDAIRMREVPNLVQED